MRRPAILERAGALTPRDRIWAAIRAFGAADTWFSVAEIMVLSEQRADTVLSYISGLEKAGFLAIDPLNTERTVLKRRELRCFNLVRDIGVDAPRIDADGKPVTQGIGDEQMWNAMRALKGTFGARELSIAASTERRVVAHATAKRYARYLAYAGYLAVAKESAGGRGSERLYRFVRTRNTGPRAPIITRDKSVMDANTGQIVLQGGKKA